MALLPVCSEYPHCMNYNFFSLCICARIQESHICELSKEWLKEMGITAIGDVMTILRHSQVKKHVSMCNPRSQAPHASNFSEAFTSLREC